MSGRTPDEGRYSKVTRRMWDDEQFRQLSAAPPNAQTLWQRLLTGPELGCIPGLYAARLGGLADALGWSIEDTKEKWAEIESKRMAFADWRAGLVWVPKAIRHNGPSSPNTVVAWRKAANQLPECALRAKAFLGISEFLTEMGPDWIGPWNLADGADWKPTKITAEVRALVRDRDGDACRYCGITANWHDRKGPTGATYDHVDPTGPASPENVVVSCRGCNSRKGFRTPEMAGLVLIQIGIKTVPVPDLDPDLGPDLDPSRNQDQEQELTDKISQKSPPPNEITIPGQDPISASSEDLTGSARTDESPSGIVPKARVSPFMRGITPPDSDEVWIFELWAKTFQKTGAVFDQRRAACLAERLISGMTLDDAEMALIGAAADDFVMGRKTGKRNDRLVFIFGDQERFEEFRDRGRALRAPRMRRALPPRPPERSLEEQGFGPPPPDVLAQFKLGPNTTGPEAVAAILDATGGGK